MNTPEVTIDHIVPISRGGSNTVDNVQPLCGTCNTSKHTKTVDYRPTPAASRDVITIAVDPNNLIQGPGTLYRAAFGATEPADTAVNTTPAASSWTDVGGTTDGVTLNIENTYSELEVDQIVERVGSRLTKRDTSVETNMAEATLQNLTYALNGGVSASGAGFASFEPNVDTAATQPAYSAILIDGFAPQLFRRRFIVRKVLSTDSISLAYTKDKQTILKVKLTAHYVSGSIKPYKIIDQTS